MSRRTAAGTSRPRRCARTRAGGRAKLLEAATAAFAEHGADAPLDDIARKAGVGIGTLYRHFPTRTDLQAAVYRSQVLAVCEAAAELIITVPPEQAFFGWVRAMAGYLATKRGLSRALIEAVREASISGCWMAMRDSTDRLLAHAQQGVLRADISAQDVLRLVHGITIATEQAPSDTDRLLALVLDGLRPSDRRCLTSRVCDRTLRATRTPRISHPSHRKT